VVRYEGTVTKPRRGREQILRRAEERYFCLELHVAEPDRGDLVRIGEALA
jgi:hypothetical protein